MLSQKQKNAIENLLILVDYIKDNSIYSDEDGKIIDKSIRTVEELIGLKKEETEHNNQEVAKLFAEEIKKRFDA